MSFSDEPDAERSQIARAVRQASTEWAQAMRTHKLAPPDDGFADRLTGLASAARREQLAWQQAHQAGLLWRPIAEAQDAEPPYELRPGTGRRGPTQLWEQFDSAVASLNRAISGTSSADVAAAFGEIHRAAGALADAVSEQDRSVERGRGAA